MLYIHISSGYHKSLLTMSARILQGPQIKDVPDMTLGQFFFNSAKKYADRICQIDAFSGQCETYASIKQRSTRVALKLQEVGVTSSDVIVICSTATLDAPVPLLAAFYLGAKVANLDPSLSARQTTHLLSLVSPKIIFVQESALSLIEESLQGLDSKVVLFGPSEKYLQFSDFLEPRAKEGDFVPVVVNREDTAIMFFSSGTTGLPKAICHTNQSFLNLAFSLYQSSTKMDTILSFTSFYWITGVIYLSCTFIGGGCRIVCGSIMEAEKIFQTIEKYKVTYIFMAPVLTYKLTNLADYAAYDTSSLFTIFTAGTPLSSAQLHRLGTIFKHTKIIFAYGLSEVGEVSMFNPLTDDKLISEKSGSCGKVVAGFTLKIVDIETGKLLGPNEKGEIRIKSPCVMRGYYHTDSSDVFDETGFLKTGDVGYYDEDNCLYVIERIKEMFKYMSWPIVPSSIEVVLHEHEAIEEAVVFGVPVNEEEGELPTACVVLKAGYNVTKEEIKDFVSKKVGDREKLRGGVYFVQELMRTSTGKLMRRQIRDNILKSLSNK